MYFFYIDESGNRDVKKRDEPYVLATVCMYENQWHKFNKHLTGMKTNIARTYDPDIRQDQLEIKANLLTKPKARQSNHFFKHLTDDDITHISTQYYDQLSYAKMAVIAVVIDKDKLRTGTSTQDMHQKAYEMLLERIQRFMENNYRKHNALIIMDDTGLNLNKRITLMHARLLSIGNNHMDFKNITEYPFFVSSQLSNGVQLADLLAYSIYHAFKHTRPDYAYLEKILPRISRLAEDKTILAGLKIWPDSKQYKDVLDKIQLRAKQQGGK